VGRVFWGCAGFEGGLKAAILAAVKSSVALPFECSEDRSF